MTDSLRDQLLGLGFKPSPKPECSAEQKRDHKRDPRQDPRRDSKQPRHGERRPGAPVGDKPDARKDPRNGPRRDERGERRGGKPDAGSPKSAGAGKPRGEGNRPPRSREEMDLAKAYAIRAQKEKEERIEAERVKQEEARVRREAKAKVEELLKDKALNDPAADIARHFPYGGKIKRVHVTAEQLKALNAGELGVVQQNGRYLLVGAALLAEAEAIFPACVALKVDPNAPAGEDPYADPQYQVPDDLVW